MEAGTLPKAARSDARHGITAALVLIAICGVVLAINHTYVYNWIFGPFELAPAMVAELGASEWVRTSTPLQDTGLVERRGFRVLGKTVPVGTVTANYKVLEIGGKLLLVKLEPQASGSPVEGRLMELPDDISPEAEERSAS